LVQNPGFEEVDSLGWAASWSRKPPFSISNESPHRGSRCLRIKNTNADSYTLSSSPLTLEVGKRYEFSAWVRTENVTGMDTGATVCVEWYGAKGQYLGGIYPPGIKGTTSDWHRIKGLLGPIPKDAVHASIACYLRKGMTGIAWWDDLELREYSGPLVDGITTNLYRNTTSGGRVLVKVGLNLSANGLAPEAIKAELEILDSQQGVINIVPARETTNREAAFEFDATTLAPATYELRCVVRSISGNNSSQISCPLERTDTPISRKAWIDAHRRLILNGQPFFPLGTYWSSISKEQLDVYAQSAFNCLMPYSSPSREQLDLAQNLGLKVIYSLKDYYAGTQYCPTQIKSASDERPAIEEKVKEMNDHPAIIAWYINDELPLSMTERLTAHRDWLEELDQEHPTWAVLYQVGEVRSYLPTFDVVGTDPYPIPNQPAKIALDYARLTNDATFKYRAVWMVPQIMNKAAYLSDPVEIEKSRAPNFDEMRSMAWQCIAAGSNGLIFYSWFDLHHESKVEPFEQRWPEICRMAEEIKRFFPVLLSIDPAPQPVNVEAPEGLGWRIYGKGNYVYLIAVNSDNAPIEALFHFPVQLTECSTELGEKTLSCEGSQVRVQFAPLEPKVIRFKPEVLLKAPTNLRHISLH
jgi:hypothetical protein